MLAETLIAKPEAAIFFLAQRERLTWTQIVERYPDTWVVAVEMEQLDPADDPDTVPIEYCSSIVLAHCASRRALSPFIKSQSTGWGEYGVFFTGPLIKPSLGSLL